MKDNNNSVQSIDRVLDILEALSAAPQGLALSELAAATSLHASTAHRLLGSPRQSPFWRPCPTRSRR